MYLKTYLSLALLFLGSCASQVAVSIPGVKGYNGMNFRHRGDSARPGDFLGPFTGTVRDKRSKYPLPKAAVTAHYYFTRKGKPVKTFNVHVVTDTNGKYFIPKLTSFPRYRQGLTLSRVDLFVRHKNYLPHIVSEHSAIFNQFDHLILLRRDMGPLKRTKVVQRALGATEESPDAFYKAAEELKSKKEVKLDSGSLLLPSQVKKILNKPSLPTVGELQSKVEESGFALTFKDGTRVTWIVWSLLAKQAQKRFRSFKTQMKNPTPVPLGDNVEAFTGMSEETRVLLLRFRREGTVLLLGCTGKKSCTPLALRTLALSALKRKSMLIFMEDWTNE